MRFIEIEPCYEEKLESFNGIYCLEPMAYYLYENVTAFHSSQIEPIAYYFEFRDRLDFTVNFVPSARL